MKTTVLLLFYALFRAKFTLAIDVGSLRVENKDSPLGIDVLPRFSWVTSSSQPGATQLSYRLTVSAAGGSVVWDSGKVGSQDTFEIEYAGATLASDTTYTWKVDVETNAGHASKSSTFTTGFLHQSDWAPSMWISKSPSTLGLTLSAAQWLWSSEPSPPISPPGDRAFRKLISAPSGKTIVFTDVLITADDHFVLFANGEKAGEAPDVKDSWKEAHRIRTYAQGSSLLLAFIATNRPEVGTGGSNAAGIIAAAQVTFSDGTVQVYYSDKSWKVNSNTTGAELPKTDDSTWPSAATLGFYGVAPWNRDVIIPKAPTLNIDQSNWIWSSEASPPNAPKGQRAFRKAFSVPGGKTMRSVDILMTADDHFIIYINGKEVGAAPRSTNGWKKASTFFTELSDSRILLAVLAENTGDNDGGAGLIGTIRINYTDGSNDTIQTDSSWKVSSSVIPGFELPSTDDSSWPAARSYGLYGIPPWNKDVALTDGSRDEYPAPLFRKEFELGKEIAHARLFYAAGGFASITLNGKPASDRVMTPGFTDYDQTAHYVVVDVKNKLLEGRNAIGVEVGRNRYAVTNPNVWSWQNSPWTEAEPAFRLILAVEYTDGTSTRLASGTDWKFIEGPTRLDDVFGGENYDARYLLPGFDQVGFNDSKWGTPRAARGPRGQLRNEANPPTRIIQTLRPVSIRKVGSSFVVEFERVIAGWVRLSLSGPSGTEITVRHGEKLKEDGSVLYEDANYFQNNFQTDRFRLAGTGTAETFEPKFSYKGFQYIQLDGWSGGEPTGENVVAKVVHDALTPQGDFETSSELLNKMHRASVRTMLNNVHSIPTDCPTYEKNGWTGDAMVGTEMFMLNLDSHNLMSKFVRDMAETIRGGPVSLIAPTSGWGRNDQAPTWHSAFILIPRWIYQYKGDRRILSTHYDSMKAYIDFERSRSPGNLASTSLGDWVAPGTSPLGENPPEDTSISATAFLYRMTIAMQEVATVLGKTDDSLAFASQASAIKVAFNNAYYNSQVGHYVGAGGRDRGVYRQTHNVLALAFGLPPDEATAQRVAASLANDVRVRGNHLNTGMLGTKWLLPVLSEAGYLDEAASVALQTTAPSWGFWFENGANTMWEHWDVAARSHDHFFLGTFEDWYFHHVLGIELTAPAFRSVTIRPLFTKHLDFARGWTETPFGNLSIDWKRVEADVEFVLGIPMGVEATLVVDGMSDVQGASSLGNWSITDGGLKIHSGSHSFVVKR